MNEVLYGRKYRILISDKENTALDVSDLHCVFRVEKATHQTPSSAECIIYNLAPETEGIILKQGYRLVIEAGYSGIAQTTESEDETRKSRNADAKKKEENPDHSQYGVIFDGMILQVMREREEGVSFKLTIQALDGDSYLFGNFVKQTMVKDSTPRQVLETVTAAAKTPTDIGGITTEISPHKLPRGKVIFGDPKKYIRNVSVDNDAMNYIEDGKIYVVKTSDPIPEGMTVVLTPESGLIGTPTQDNGGVNIRSLLNPRLKIKGMVKIDNNLVRMQKAQIGQMVVPLDEDGEYLIIKVVHIGDTRNNDWYTDVYGMGRMGNNLLIAQNQNTKVVR